MVLLPTERAETSRPTIPVEKASPLLRQHRAALARCLTLRSPKGRTATPWLEQAREWKIAVEQAENVARLAGKLPAGVTRTRPSFATNSNCDSSHPKVDACVS